jgi:hypothetical protein
MSDIPLTPRGPSIKDLFGSSTTYIHHDIGQDRDPYFTINTKRRKASGLTLKQCREFIREMLLSNLNDPYMLEQIRIRSLPFIPVRSGRLADTFFNTMNIRRRSWYTHYVWAFGTEWSPLRPRPITGNVSKLGKGYGEHYIPTNLIPNRHLLYGTKGGNALYILDDPAAVNDPIPAIKDIAEETMEQEFHDVWDNTIITLHI